MCGIAGFIGGLDEVASRELVTRMQHVMTHRGPDADGIFVSAGVALAHNRLKIIDLSSAADQPFRSADGRYSIVFNGEIYNYREIAQELGAVSLNTNSDTEVLLLAFIRWGADCLERLNGMFAFAIWDDLKKELFMARDRLGIKPLYYHKSDKDLLFASEVRSILASGMVSRKLDGEALTEYLAYHTVHAPNTLIDGVQMLLPGYCAHFRNGQLTQHCYWDPQDDRIRYEGDYSKVKGEVRSRLREAVERRLIADVPLGAFLSGGIDSTAMVGLMAELRDTTIHTFSVVFDEKEFSEQEYAALVAKKFNTDHHVLPLKSEDLLASLPEILAQMDHPSVDGPNTYMVSKATKEAGVTVAISGLGGDELFAGYPVFKQIPSLMRNPVIRLVPQGLRVLISDMAKPLARSSKGAKGLSLLAANHDFTAIYPLLRRVRDNSLIKQFVGRGYDGSTIGASDVEALLREEKLLSAVSVGEIKTYMQNVLLRDADQMSMAHALEIRVPFLDHEVVELVLGLSDEMKQPVSPKRLLVDSLSPLIPNEVVHRTKMGFTFPWEAWIKNDLAEFCQTRLQSLAESDYFNSAAVLKLWSDYQQGNRSIHWTHIWSLVVLSNWMHQHEIQ